MGPYQGKRPERSSWIELSGEAFAHNLQVLREISAPADFGVVLKGNAYGHGLEQLGPLALQLADTVYVIEPREALWLRGQADTDGRTVRLVVLGACGPGEAVELARAGIEVAITGDDHLQWAEALKPHGLRLKVHVHVDTGLGREGPVRGGYEAWMRTLAAHTDVFDFVGLMTHLANTEDVTEQDYAREQVAGLREALQAWKLVGLPDDPFVHAAASAASMVLPSSRLSGVRCGIAAYGLWPSTETRIGLKLLAGTLPELHPVMRWRVRSQIVKTVPEGGFIGYGCTHRCARDTTVAVLPVGYFDGYPRRLSNRGHVLVDGHRCPVLGRVMMNHLIVDVTEVPDVGDEIVATLLGTDGSEVLRAEQLADWADTINYEIVTRLGQHLWRVVLPTSGE